MYLSKCLKGVAFNRSVLHNLLTNIVGITYSIFWGPTLNQAYLKILVIQSSGSGGDN